jgi:MFS family permease
MTVGMLLSATANDVIALSIWRVVTGLGIGGMLASINAMVAE